jgi:amidase
VASPAETSGVIGFKPTRNLIFSEGLIHASKRLDTVGLITRDVTDAPYVLFEVIYRSTHHSPPTKLKIFQDLTPACRKLDLSGMRIGIPWHLADFASLHDAKLVLFKRVVDALGRVGDINVDDVRVTGAREFEALPPSKRNIILDTDMKVAIETYLSDLKTNSGCIRSLRDLIAFTKVLSGRGVPDTQCRRFRARRGR